ncbi:lanthionine synthetase LanC family protein [Olivibacter jilunii]|uniref:lanthionine synthetase LanC family protein n=1 Tax=Olivibacter jilunii TaxID=985016 RepID=UPI003F159CD3
MQNLIPEKVIKIEEDVFDMVRSQRIPASLYTGFSGLALLQYKLFLYTGSDIYLERMSDILDKVLSILKLGGSSYSYCDGVTGIAFLFNYLLEQGVLDDSVEPLLRNIDSLLISIVRRGKNVNTLDFLHGNLGVYNYLIDRYKQDKLRHKDILELLSIYHKDLSKYLKPALNVNNLVFRPDNDQNYSLNCGFAHGVLAHIVLCCKIEKLLPLQTTSNHKLGELVSVLQLFKRKANQVTAPLFPSIVKYNSSTFDTTYDVPLGWCYGDLITAFSLIYLGSESNNIDLLEEGIEIADRTIYRKTSDTTQHNDASFCHGAAGVAFLYKRLYELTHIDRYVKAYDYWLSITMNEGRFSDGVGGYKKSVGRGFSNEVGLLDGAAGIGIVLLDALSGIDGKSDIGRFFLLN